MRAFLDAPPRRENDWAYIERTGRGIKRSRKNALNSGSCKSLARRRPPNGS